MRIQKRGNVGIGTTNPSSKLHVKINSVTPTSLGRFENPDGQALLQIKAKSDSYSILEMADAEDGNVGAVWYDHSNNSMRFKTNDSEKVRILSNGNVGIGTTDPLCKFHVRSGDDTLFYIDGVTAYESARFTSTAGGRSISLLSSGSTGSNYIGSLGNNHSLRFFTTKLSDSSRNTHMTITEGGNVGIGTTNPAQKLDVHGNIAVNGTTVHTSDDRVKHNEQPIVGALETLSKITPKKYIKTIEMYDANHDFELDADGNPVDENGEPVEHRVEAGVIAQQVLTVDELAFAVSPEGVDEDGAVTSPHGLDYNSLFTYAIAAIQEQQQLIDDLKSQNESLAARISALES